ncbi:phenylalanine--tRNA ligase subunit beta, partial [Candidatus Gracilibacteria bacterium]|nr:phenylalanine--tRNA ligase subunit beta [Candidatus Gracilibacteria bacterium]
VAEVEKIHAVAAIPKVVVGQILKIESIPDADKIQLATVDIGSEKLQIVCGAKNIFEGAKVPVALVGCVLSPSMGSCSTSSGQAGQVAGFKIEKRKLKGVESCGMICSEAELGLAEKSEGIFVLDDSAEIGQPFTSDLTGTIFEIDNHAITHRPDLFSHVGFAREIAVLLDRKFKARELALPKIEQKIDVEVAEPKLCSRYSGLMISGIKIKPSPKKIRERLESCGIRAINNVVDATNFVLLELGQPLHAFDSKKLAGGWIIVRRAKNSEKLKTLDGEVLELSSENLVIADAEKPIALAGVMGGANSEVSEVTTEIILEAANFGAVSIRKTSIKFGLRSESSLRFEKRLDPELPPKAIARFLEVLRETNPELKIFAEADIKNFTPEKRVLELSLVELEKKLGSKISPKRSVEILRALGFRVEELSEKDLKVEVPSFRAGRDIERPIDLMEEVIRHLGYKNLPADFPRIRMTVPSVTAGDSFRELKSEIEDALVGFGFHETATLSLVSEKLLRSANQKIEIAFRLENPPSEDYRHLRNSLLASLLEAASKNVRREKSFRLFEVSTVFQKNSDERNLAVALIVGEKNSFLAVRGVLEKLFASLKFPAEFSEAISLPTTAHPGRVADIKIAGKKIGTVAELHPAVAKNFELPTSVFFDLDFDALSQIPQQAVTAVDLPKFPGVPRDLAVLVSRKTLVREVENAILSADSKIHDLRLFDVYEGEGIPTEMKSLAFSFEIRDKNKTLEEKEAEEVFQKIVANIESVGGKLRSGLI